MKRILGLVLALFVLVPVVIGADVPASVYDFTLNRIDGTRESLATYRGQVLLLVNVASRCGNTPQYAGLESLYAQYRDQGFVVLGFPANDFGGQEPGSNAQIADYCRATWAVDFPMFEKISVRGDKKHPLYAYLTAQPAPLGGEIEWNFQKFLIGRDGRVAERFSPGTQPLDADLVASLEKLLAVRSASEAAPRLAHRADAVRDGQRVRP
jgi:glutathione peroxidase